MFLLNKGIYMETLPILPTSILKMEAVYTSVTAAILLTSRLCKHPRVETRGTGNHCLILKLLRFKLKHCMVGILEI
jgi:hypothetical protein